MNDDTHHTLNTVGRGKSYIASQHSRNQKFTSRLKPNASNNWKGRIPKLRLLPIRKGQKDVDCTLFLKTQKKKPPTYWAPEYPSKKLHTSLVIPLD